MRWYPKGFELTHWVDYQPNHRRELRGAEVQRVSIEGEKNGVSNTSGTCRCICPPSTGCLLVLAPTLHR